MSTSLFSLQKCEAEVASRIDELHSKYAFTPALSATLIKFILQHSLSEESHDFRSNEVVSPSSLPNDARIVSRHVTCTLENSDHRPRYLKARVVSHSIVNIF